MDLASVRNALGISQAELERRAKLPRGTVQELESGKNQNPSVKVCGAIVTQLRKAGAVGVTVESLFLAEVGQ